MSKDGIVFALDVVIQPEELQSEYQHLYHPDVMKVLERARLAYVAARGFSAERMRAQGILLIISRIDVRFLREIVAEPLRVTVERVYLEGDGKTFVMEQKILKQNGKRAVEALAYSMCMSAAARRGIPPPTDFLEALQSVESAKGC